MRNQNLGLKIRQLFDKFCDQYLLKAKMGNLSYYDGLISINTSCNQNSLNSIFKTEADIKVKFGGFLEIEFQKNDLPYTVHSELDVYDKAWADLTIHSIDPKNYLWLNKEDILISMLACIEIKYENYKDPHYEYKRGAIKKDINKLTSLNKSVTKFMMIIDEANKISNETVEQIKKCANKNNIILLSNNPKFQE